MTMNATTHPSAGAPAGREQQLAVGGLRLNILEWGPVDGRPVVMLHGLRDAAQTFGALAQALQPRYRTIAIDLRGRGGSDWDPLRSYYTATYVADLLAVVDALALASFDLLGHSMGGGIAIVFASTYPARVRRLILEDAGPGVFDASPGSARLRQEMASIPTRFDTLAQARAAWQRMRPALTPQQLDQRMPSMFKQAAQGGHTWRYDHAGIAEARLSADPARAVDLRAHVERLRCLTLLLRGGASTFMLREMAHAMQAVNARIRCEEIAGAGHYVHEEAPEAFALAVRNFLDNADADLMP